VITGKFRDTLLSWGAVRARARFTLRPPAEPVDGCLQETANPFVVLVSGPGELWILLAPVGRPPEITLRNGHALAVHRAPRSRRRGK
jgi:hypothetical protein